MTARSALVLPLLGVLLSAACGQVPDSAKADRIADDGPDCIALAPNLPVADDRTLPIGWTRRWTGTGQVWEPGGSASATVRSGPVCYLFPVPAAGTWLLTFGVNARTDRTPSTYDVSADPVIRHASRRVTTDGTVQRITSLVAARTGPLRVTVLHRDTTTAITSAAITLVRHGTSPLHVAFADEFTGDRGAPEKRNWRTETGSGKWGNNELQTYTTDEANVRVSSGRLAISAQRHQQPPAARYTSGRINSTFSGTYGRIEARIKVPDGAGLLPAFWMLGADAGRRPWPACGEIDIMEHLGTREPTTIHASMHGPDPNGAPWTQTRSTVTAAPTADDFHVYALDWWPGLVQASVDGQVFASYTPDDLQAGQEWVFDKPFYLLLNVAVGGDWPGNPADALPFPQTMLVDYVRWRQ